MTRPILKRSSKDGPSEILSSPPKRQRSTARVVTPESSKRVRSGVGVNMSLDGYRDLRIPPAELRPASTLTTGQCFHWKAIQDEQKDADRKLSAWGSHDASDWIGTLRTSNGKSTVIAIRQTPKSTLYRVIYGPDELDYDSFLRDYFQLDESLVSLYEEWSTNCPRLKKIAACLPGVRIINQDPWECLVSFICSSNNNIPRITKMLNSIREQYGELLITEDNEKYYSFPSYTELHASATEKDLRELCGMGYRAKYIMETMGILSDLGGEQYLRQLREIDDPVDVQQKLCQFHGVGRKVADCVALFSLKQANAIPVDVHVWNIARRDYDKNGELTAVKSLTPKIYALVGDLFRSRFPTKSGWAHSLLFVAELPSFRAALPKQFIDEIDEFKREEKARKKEKKNEKST